MSQAFFKILFVIFLYPPKIQSKAKEQSAPFWAVLYFWGDERTKGMKSPRLPKKLQNDGVISSATKTVKQSIRNSENNYKTKIRCRHSQL